MRAWVLRGIDDLKIDDVPAPEPKEGEVLVKVKAAGICSSDVHRVYSTGAYHYPIILGHEFSGVTGDGVRVGVFPLLPCHCCEFCVAQQYETCINYSYLGSRQDGAFAEYVAVREWNLITLPDSITFEQAAMLEPAAVALHAVKRLDVRGAESVAVIGDGAIGLLIAKWLSILCDAKVGVFGRSDIPPLERYDICIEAVGSSDAYHRCIELTRPNGQLLLVGNPNIDFGVSRELHWQVLRKQLNVRGSWNSSYPADWQETIDMADALQLDCFISNKYRFCELDRAFVNMHGKSKCRGKAVVVFD